MEEEKIIAMLRSGEEGNIRLGAILALGMGAEWCFNTLRAIAMNNTDNKRHRHTWPVISNCPSSLDGTLYLKDNLAISFKNNQMYCDYYYRTFTAGSYYYKIINLDEN